MARSAHHEAVAYFEQALSALAHLPEQRDTREQAIDLRLALRSALLPSGDSGRILDISARGRGPRRGPRRSASAGTGLGLSVHTISTTGVRMTRPSPPASAPSRSPRPAGMSSCTRWRTSPSAAAYQAQGDYRRAIDCFGQTVASFDGARRYERFGHALLPAVLSRAWLAACHAELGTFAEGRALGEEGLRIAEAVEHPGSLIVCLRGGSVCCPSAKATCPERSPCSNGPWASVRKRTSRSISPGWLRPWAWRTPSSGRVADAVPLLTQAMEQSTAHGNSRLSGALSSLPGGGAAAGWPPGGGTRPRRARAGARPCAPGTRQRGVCPAPPRRDRGAA